MGFQTFNSAIETCHFLLPTSLNVPGYSPTCSALRAIAATANNPVKK